MLQMACGPFSVPKSYILRSRWCSSAVEAIIGVLGRCYVAAGQFLRWQHILV